MEKDANESSKLLLSLLQAHCSHNPYQFAVPGQCSQSKVPRRRKCTECGWRKPASGQSPDVHMVDPATHKGLRSCFRNDDMNADKSNENSGQCN